MKINTTPVDKKAALTASSLNPNFTIYYGNQRQKMNSEKGSNQLVVGNMVYETQVNGIDQILKEKDFRGILTIKCDSNNATEHLVFAVWFCLKKQTYLLVSVGQYSDHSYHDDLETYWVRDRPGKRMRIRLFPLHAEMLANLQELLTTTHLSHANVLILKETVGNTQYH